MSDQNHTPGPWRLDSCPEGAGTFDRYGIRAKDGARIIWYPDSEDDDAGVNGLANATLICAVTDLLSLAEEFSQALRFLLKDSGECECEGCSKCSGCRQLARVDSVIAKATGKGGEDE